jgi:DNA-binding CsgD family transcriptional regulator
LQGNLAAAVELSQRAGHIIRQLGSFAFIDLVVDYVRLMVMVARSEFARLETFVQEAESRLQKVETQRTSLNRYWFALWRAYWLQDRWEDAQPVMSRFLASLDEIDRAKSPTIAMMEGWQAYANKQLLLAEEKLVETARRHRKLRWIGTWGNAGIDLAIFYLLENRPQEALAIWREAAAEMQKREMPGQPLFTGHKAIPLLKLAVKENVYPEIALISLDAFGESDAPRSIPLPGSSETLTPRETEVLQLLMTGATNQEIADQLVITKRTAKAHVSHILQKLQVASRTEAVARAHELSLL